MQETTAVALLFLAGSVVFFGLGFGIAAAQPDLSRSGQGAAQLPAIARHARAWRGIPAAFGTAIVLTTLGFALVAWWLRDGSAGGIAAIAATLYTLAAAAMLPTLTFQWGAKVRAAEEQARSGEIPAWFLPFELWSENLYGAYMLLAFTAIAVEGVAFAILTGTDWLAVFSALFGVTGALTFAARRPKLGDLVISDLPLWIHVWAAVTGLALLLN